MTQYAFNAAGLMTRMTYPGTKSINFTYKRHLLLNTVSSSSYTYARHVKFAAAGRFAVLKPWLTGSNAMMQSDFHKNLLTGPGGRMQWWKAEVMSDAESQRCFEYNGASATSPHVRQSTLVWAS